MKSINLKSYDNGLILLGVGKARDFSAPNGYHLMEKGAEVYACPDDYFCCLCDGCGCKSCKYTGEELVRITLKSARQRSKKARKKAKL